ATACATAIFIAKGSAATEFDDASGEYPKWTSHGPYCIPGNHHSEAWKGATRGERYVRQDGKQSAQLKDGAAARSRRSIRARHLPAAWEKGEEGLVACIPQSRNRGVDYSDCPNLCSQIGRAHV